MGHAGERVLQGVGVALQHEVLTEDGEAQALGLAVDVVRGAQVLLGQEAAQVDRGLVLVRVRAVLLGRGALEVLAQAQLGRRPPVSWTCGCTAAAGASGVRPKKRSKRRS